MDKSVIQNPTLNPTVVDLSSPSVVGNVQGHVIQDSSVLGSSDSNERGVDPSFAGTSAGRGSRDPKDDLGEPVTVVDTTGSGRGGDTVTDVSSRNSNGAFDLDPAVDIDSLSASMQSIMSQLLSGNLVSSGQLIGDFISTLQNYLKNHIEGLNNDEATQLTGQVYGIVSNYLSALYNNMYARQNWLLENDYNSPKSQMTRLMAAGINPAFYFGSLGSSNSGQISQTEMQPGSIDYQPQSPLSDGMQKFMSGVETVGSLATTAAGVVSGIGNFKAAMSSARDLDESAQTRRVMRLPQLAESLGNVGVALSQCNFLGAQTENIKQMTPLQTRNLSLQNMNLGQDYKNKIAQNEVIRTQANFNRAQAYSLIEGVNIGYENIRNQLRIANISASATKYAADKSYDGTLASLNVAIAKNDVDSAIEIIKSIMSEHENVTYEELNGDAGIEVSMSRKAEIDALIGSGQAEFDANGHLNIGGKIYRQKRTTDRTLDLRTFDAMYNAFHMVVNRGYESNNPTLIDPIKHANFVRGFGHYVGHVSDYADKEFQKSVGHQLLDDLRSGQGKAFPSFAVPSLTR